MNVLYILGNGFDKAQGMKTSYPEFYEYLKTIEKGKLTNTVTVVFSSPAGNFFNIRTKMTERTVKKRSRWIRKYLSY